jgi:Zn-dependent protease with chaperone function
VAHGLLAAGAVVIGAVGLWLEPVERLSSSLVLVALVAGVVWALAMASVAFSLIRRPTMSVVGQVLDPSRQRSLADFVAEVSQAVGAEPPAHTVACLIPWLFVTEMKVACLDGTVSGRTLCLSLPLVRILSVDEFRAQLAHELAHYSREQAALTVRVVSAFVGASRAMRDLAGRSRGLRAVVSRPPLALVSVFMNAVGGDAALGGDCEAAADQAACAVAGREALASGLVKLAAFAPAWHAVFAMMQSAAFADTQYLNVGAVFQEIAASNSGRDRLAGVGATMQGHPTDRHPALSERLAALGLDLGDVADAALLTVPVLSAASLIEGGETIEQRLTTVEHQMIVETGGRIPAA